MKVLWMIYAGVVGGVATIGVMVCVLFNSHKMMKGLEWIMDKLPEPKL